MKGTLGFQVEYNPTLGLGLVSSFPLTVLLIHGDFSFLSTLFASSTDFKTTFDSSFSKVSSETLFSSLTH